MHDRTQRIKNLAIALEALYRTPETTQTYEVERLLVFEIDKHKEENKHTRAIEPSTTTDDDIPF